MVKKMITYKDFNDNEITEEFAFHLSAADLLEMETEYSGGIEAHLEQMQKTKDGAMVFQFFKKLITRSSGKISEDGKRFDTSPDARNAFLQSNAYSKLLLELASGTAEDAAKFFNGVIPEGLGEAAERIEARGAQPQRERAEAERTPVEERRPEILGGQPQEKVMTQVEARQLSQDELVARMKDGWTIQS